MKKAQNSRKSLHHFSKKHSYCILLLEGLQWLNKAQEKVTIQLIFKICRVFLKLIPNIYYKTFQYLLEYFLHKIFESTADWVNIQNCILTMKERNNFSREFALCPVFSCGVRKSKQCTESLFPPQRSEISISDQTSARAELTRCWTPRAILERKCWDNIREHQVCSGEGIKELNWNLFDIALNPESIPPPIAGNHTAFSNPNRSSHQLIFFANQRTHTKKILRFVRYQSKLIFMLL